MSYNNNNYNNNKNNGGKAGALADYITVNERIIEFYKKYPEGRITTDIVSWENGIIIMKATVYRNFEDEKELAVGHAYEKEDASFINKTSALENCYHEETDILTEKGWFNIKYFIENKLYENIKIGQIDLDTNELSFDYPLDTVIQENKSFIKLEDNLTCQVVTPEHYVVIDNKKMFAKDVITEKWGRTKTNNFKHNFNYSNNGINESDDFIRLLQWVIADGYIDFKYNHIKFGFVKERKVKRVLELLDAEGIKYSTYINKDNNIYRINIKQANNIIKYIPEKTIDFNFVMSLSEHQRKVFIEEIALTDGYEATRGGIYLRQSDKTYFENLALMAVMSGYDVCSPIVDTNEYEGRYNNSKPIYRLRLKPTVRRVKTIKEDYGVGTAYCFKMPKGTLITKFNNKITVSSNCETSAVGRALALAGFEIKKSIASREEVANAIHQQQLEEDKRKPTEAQFKRFYAMLKEAYMRESDILSFYNKRTKKNITKETMSLADYDKITQYLQKEIDAKLQGGK